MLAIQSTSINGSTKNATINILPCRIHHTGPTSTRITKRHWSPSTSTPTDPKQSTLTSYFRGRRLLGTSLFLPRNYTGIIASSTDKVLPKTYAPIKEGDSDIEEEEQEEDVKVLEVKGRFEEVVVWGHDAVVDAEEDAFVRGLGEWIAFAESMHGTNDEKDVDGNDKS
jgi:ribonuclease H2 subunit C